MLEDYKKLSGIINMDTMKGHCITVRKPMFMNEYITEFSKGDNNMLMNEEESKELTSKQLETIIKDNNIEVDKEDNDYVYMYLTTDINGKLIEGINCNVNKTIASKDGIKAYTLEKAKSNGYQGNFTSADEVIFISSFYDGSVVPENPSILKEQTFKIFKVKINKNNIKTFENNYNEDIIFFWVTELEIIEEVQIKNKISYKIQNIIQANDNNGDFYFTFKIINRTTGRNILVNFVSNKIDLSQKEIQAKIKGRLNIMQAIYDKYQASNGELDL